MESGNEDRKARGDISKILLVNCDSTLIVYEDKIFEVTYRDNRIRISLDHDNYVVVQLKNQQVSYKSTILGGYALSEKMSGEVGYSKYFSIDWEEELFTPEVYFERPPERITRNYGRGQWIELGIEDISTYHVTYRDGVEADFNRSKDKGFAFSFSTGFYGSFREEPDGSYILTFKGDRLKPGEDDYRSQSKFIFSRSKYTGKPLLILQDEAIVALR